MASSPVYAATPKTGSAVISAANTNRDGTGTIVTLFTPGVNGSRVLSATAVATVTTAALQIVRLFRSTDGGTTWRTWRELILPAVSLATGTPGAAVSTSFIDAAGNALTIASTDRIGAAAELANAINIITEYADL